MRSPWHIPRLIVLAIFVAYFGSAFVIPYDWRLIDSVNLVIHEAGHTLAFFLGQFFYVLAGSLLQIIFPLMFALYFFRRGEEFSGHLILLWVAQNFVSVAIYAADAEAMELDLIGGEHDWNYLLGTIGLLSYSRAVGTILYVTGAMLALYAFGGALRASKKVP